MKCCYRFGKKIDMLPQTQAVFPMLFVTLLCDKTLNPTHVDLCEECTKEFTEGFLGKKGE